jgi:hypothetical protein
MCPALFLSTYAYLYDEVVRILFVGRSYYGAVRTSAGWFKLVEMVRSDPHWCDLTLFYEYFHSDNGVGMGASRQTERSIG